MSFIPLKFRRVGVFSDEFSSAILFTGVRGVESVEFTWVIAGSAALSALFLPSETSKSDDCFAEPSSVFD